MSGIVYMVQPAELVGSNKFKIGCSSKNDLSRCKKAYKVGTRYIHIMECTDPLTVEKEIIQVFKGKFKLVCGREFFEGKETDMEEEFYKIVKNRNKLAQKASNKPKSNIKSKAKNEQKPATKKGISNAVVAVEAGSTITNPIDSPIIKINPIGFETFDHLTEKDIESVLSAGEDAFKKLAYLMYKNPENQNLCFHIRKRNLVKFVGAYGCLIIDDSKEVMDSVTANIQFQLGIYIDDYCMASDTNRNSALGRLLSELEDQNSKMANFTTYSKTLYLVLITMGSVTKKLLSKYEKQLNMTGTLCDCPDKICAANHPKNS
jgi:hypothetical protein